MERLSYESLFLLFEPVNSEEQVFKKHIYLNFYTVTNLLLKNGIL